MFLVKLIAFFVFATLRIIGLIAFAVLDKSGWIANEDLFRNGSMTEQFFGRRSSDGICGFYFSSFEGITLAGKQIR